MWVIVTAAGSSRRMGGVNKLLMPLHGKPLLVHTLSYFEKHSLVRGVVVSAPADQREVYLSLVREHGLSKVVAVVAGGAERQDSIRNALGALSCSAEEAVAIHDGARPCLSGDLLERLVEALQGAEGSLPMVAVKDTIKRVDGQGKVLQTLVRSELFAAQTPQVFRYAAIVEAHRKAHAEGYLGTDDCSLIEYFGGTIRAVEGDYRNLKVTTPEDVEMVEAYV
ncbi:MAG: 2-C-methyl-D-erythritol 4-phosphate cytidylyltransferase [Candidatus Eremiobacteraeota bacterium]|nr:2-C-methyl-D-erythritol 4-phosphate cytidylyltransferase [Candidatus Eremiobacteraeota bacterium]